MPFPQEFTWGVATASYQIEGSPLRAGGGASVWDMFCERAGAIDNAETGWESCNHYELYKQDVALMRELGVNAYRLSLSWPRILPDGTTGKVNEEGLGFYDRLVDELLAAGVQPWVTLFHWDFPYALFNRGGWLSPDSSHWFADYTQLVVDRLSDRVKRWMTLNEPQCFIGLGHYQGVHAPGEKMQLSQVLLAAHNAMLSHGRAVQVIRASSKSEDAKVGFAPVGVVSVPANKDNPADVDAARAQMFSVSDGTSLWNNTWWIDPIMKGEYPEDGLKAYGKAAPKPAPGDLETMSQPLDFFGANIYHATRWRAGANGKPEEVTHPVGLGRTSIGWPVVAESLYWGARFFHERYGKPIVVTENGMANTDWVHSDGQVDDPARVDFLRRHLKELRRARDEAGADVQGYFQWSFMDNFEWAEGYKMRFGLVHVDYQTQQRTPKASYHWYKDVIAANGENL